MPDKIIAIDTHTHINHGHKLDSNTDNKLYDATLSYLRNATKAAGIEKMFCSTFASVLSDEFVEEENEYMYSLAQETEYLYQWVVLDPQNDNTLRQAERMLQSKKCVGLKLHPVCHKYALTKYGDKLFSFAAEHKAIVLIHPETDADYILPFANKYPNVTFIMAHMGSYRDDSYANAIEFSENGNVYTDTSGIASSHNRGVEYVVDRVGSLRILFGTDTYAPGFQRGRIDYALISDEDKYNILCGNAQKLFEKWL